MMKTFSDSYPVWFCDIWGVVHNGVAPFPVTVAALKRHREAGGTLVLAFEGAPGGAPKQDLAFTRFENSSDDTTERRFAAARFTDEAKRFARGNCEINAIKRMDDPGTGASADCVDEPTCKVARLFESARHATYFQQRGAERGIHSSG